MKYLVLICQLTLNPVISTSVSASSLPTSIPELPSLPPFSNSSMKPPEQSGHV